MDTHQQPVWQAYPVQVLFIDFDGVLHPEFCNESQHFMHRDSFEAILRAFPKMDVVISSTWRLKRQLPELKALFSEDVAERVIGLTPLYAELENIPDRLVGYEREAECLAWLQRHDRASQSWRALDDRSWSLRPFNRNVFLSDGHARLDADVASRSRDRLALTKRKFG